MNDILPVEKDEHGLPLNNSNSPAAKRFGMTLSDYYESLGIEVHNSGSTFWGINANIEGCPLTWFAINYVNEEDLPEPDKELMAELCSNGPDGEGERLDRGGVFPNLAALLEEVARWRQDFLAGEVKSLERGEVISPDWGKSPGMKP